MNRLQVLFDRKFFGGSLWGFGMGILVAQWAFNADFHFPIQLVAFLAVGVGSLLVHSAGGESRP